MRVLPSSQVQGEVPDMGQGAERRGPKRRWIKEAAHTPAPKGLLAEKSPEPGFPERSTPQQGSCHMLLNVVRWPDTPKWLRTRTSAKNGSSHDPEQSVRAGTFQGGEPCWRETLEPARYKGSCPGEYSAQIFSTIP